MAQSQTKSIPQVLSDLIDLVKTYAQQQTIDPLKSLGRFVGWGAAGAVTLGIGTVLVLVGVLRALQTQTGSVFTGSLSWAPYLITVAIAAVLTGLALAAITRKPKELRR